MTATSILWLYTLFAIACLRTTTEASSNEELQQKYDQVVDEVTDLKETMMKMREDMKMMKTISKALNNLCAELQLPGSPTEPVVEEQEHSSTVGNGTGKNSEEQEPFSTVGNKTDEVYGEDNNMEEEAQLTTRPFQIYSLEVYNETFRIEYDGVLTNEAVYTEYDSPILNMTSLKPEKLFSTTKGVIIGTVRASSNYFSIVAGDFAASISFMPNNQTSSEIELEPLQMASDVQKCVVFEPGQKAQFDVTVKENKKDPSHFELGIYTPFEDGIVNLVTRGSPGIVNITRKKEYPGYEEFSITVNGDKEDHEGLLYLTISTIQSDIIGFEHMFYSVHQMLEVRRTDHKSPFELGYIGFVKSEYVNTNFDMGCNIGNMCRLGVTLVGNMPADVTLWRLILGTKIQLKVPKHRAEFGNYVIIIAFYLPTTSVNDQGTYIYRGTSHIGTVVEREFELTVYSA